MQRNSQRAGEDGNPAVAPACKWTAEGARKAGDRIGECDPVRNVQEGWIRNREGEYFAT